MSNVDGLTDEKLDALLKEAYERGRNTVAQAAYERGYAAALQDVKRGMQETREKANA